MISFVKGTVADIGENCLVVENGGIGYEIYMTGQDLGKARIGDEKKIHTFLYVREDILQLYGFFSKDDLGMFKLLIGVNGVGPKGALGILSGISADELRFACKNNLQGPWNREKDSPENDPGAERQAEAGRCF